MYFISVFYESGFTGWWVTNGLEIDGEVKETLQDNKNSFE